MRASGVLLIAIGALLVACGAEEPDPDEAGEPVTTATEASEQADTTPGEDVGAEGLCGAVERLEDAVEAVDSLTVTVWEADDPTEDGVRDYAIALEAAAEAFDDVAVHLDERFGPLLDAPARSYEGIAGVLADLDYDLTRLEDPDTAARLGDAVLPLLGPDDDPAADADLADDLAATVADACPDLEATVFEQEAAGRVTPADPPSPDGHTVSLAPEAVERIHDTGALVVESFEDDEAFPDPIPCPLWDPDDATAALDGLLESEADADVGQRQHGPGDGWMFGCATLRRAGETGSPDLVVRAQSPPDELERRTEAEPISVEGHAAWEATGTTARGEAVHVAFAVDPEADLDIVARASTPELARAGLAVVLDHLVDADRP